MEKYDIFVNKRLFNLALLYNNTNQTVMTEMVPYLIWAQEIWAPRSLGPKKLDPQEIWSTHENHFNAWTKISRGPNSLGTKFLGNQISREPNFLGTKKVSNP